MRASPAFLVLTTTLAACGSSPKTHFYTLQAAPPESSSAHSRSSAPLEVSHVDLPGTLDRLPMVTRGSGNRVNVSDQDRWSAPLDELVRRAMTADLRERLPEGQMVAPGGSLPHGGSTLTLNVQQFIADSVGHVVLEAEWSLQSSGRPARPRHESIQVTVPEQGGEAVADGMSRALGELADRIAAAV